MRKVAVEAGEHLAPLGLELQVSAVVSRRRVEQGSLALRPQPIVRKPLCLASVRVRVRVALGLGPGLGLGLAVRVR